MEVKMCDLAEKEKELFVVDDDLKAEWCLVKIKETMQEYERLIEVCKAKTEEYKAKIEKYQGKCESDTSYFKSQLNQYFQTVEKRKTKTQEIYELPSGKLKLKYQNPEIKRDDKKLLQWLKENKKESYIKTKETPDWGEFKKETIVAGNNILTKDGEIIDGVNAIDRPPIFEVEVG